MVMKRLVLVFALIPSAYGQIDDPTARFRAVEKEMIIPALIEYEPPPHHSPIGGRRITGFAHDDHELGPTISSGISFRVSPVGMIVGKDKKVHAVALTWETLRIQLSSTLKMINWNDATLTAEKIDGRKVLVLDFEEIMPARIAWPRVSYNTRVWIPIDRDIVLELSLNGSSPELRAVLKQSLSKLRIKRYRELEQGSATPVAGSP